MTVCSQGKYEEATPLYRRAVEIREKALGPEDPDLAIILTNLAESLLHKVVEALVLGDSSLGRKYEEVKLLNERAIEIGEKTLRPDHPDLAGRYNNLATLFSIVVGGPLTAFMIHCF